jgi:hypothetical protein
MSSNRSSNASARPRMNPDEPDHDIPAQPEGPDGVRQLRQSASLSLNSRVQPCPLRARQEEHPRVITVTQRQTTKIPAGYGVSRSLRYSATDFPS